MAEYIEVRAAYGREYKRQADIQADYNAGMDFQMALTGQYVNKQDAEEQNLKLMVRYNRDVLVYVVK